MLTRGEVHAGTPSRARRWCELRGRRAKIRVLTEDVAI
jgi:hypothetical protein